MKKNTAVKVAVGQTLQSQAIIKGHLSAPIVANIMTHNRCSNEGFKGSCVKRSLTAAVSHIHLYKKKVGGMNTLQMRCRQRDPGLQQTMCLNVECDE